jgi:hypothetical protein
MPVRARVWRSWRQLTRVRRCCGSGSKAVSMGAAVLTHCVWLATGWHWIAAWLAAHGGRWARPRPWVQPGAAVVPRGQSGCTICFVPLANGDAMAMPTHRAAGKHAHGEQRLIRTFLVAARGAEICGAGCRRGARGTRVFRDGPSFPPAKGTTPRHRRQNTGKPDIPFFSATAATTRR